MYACWAQPCHWSCSHYSREKRRWDYCKSPTMAIAKMLCRLFGLTEGKYYSCLSPWQPQDGMCCCTAWGNSIKNKISCIDAHVQGARERCHTWFTTTILNSCCREASKCSSSALCSGSSTRWSCRRKPTSSCVCASLQGKLCWVGYTCQQPANVQDNRVVLP